MNFPSIYLASNSPRRRELLTQIGVDFTVLSVDVDERHFENESPVDYVQRVAIAKAQAGWDSVDGCKKKPVMGSDTSVVLTNDVLGKPTSEEHAKEMLQHLSGQCHKVLTAVAIVTEEKVWLELSTSKVTFAELTHDDINWYLSTQEGVDKAGGYAVQGLAAVFIEKIEGSYSGIMGLPLRETALLLTRISHEQ